MKASFIKSVDLSLTQEKVFKTTKANHVKVSKLITSKITTASREHDNNKMKDK